MRFPGGRRKGAVRSSNRQSLPCLAWIARRSTQRAQSAQVAWRPSLPYLDSHHYSEHTENCDGNQHLHHTEPALRSKRTERRQFPRAVRCFFSSLHRVSVKAAASDVERNQRTMVAVPMLNQMGRTKLDADTKNRHLQMDPSCSEPPAEFSWLSTPLREAAFHRQMHKGPAANQRGGLGYGLLASYCLDCFEN